MMKEVPLTNKRGISLLAAASLMVSGIALAASAYGLHINLNESPQTKDLQAGLAKMSKRLSLLEKTPLPQATKTEVENFLEPSQWAAVLERLASLEQRSEYRAEEQSLPVDEAHDVGQLQYSLTRLGYDTGGIDCVVGPRTIAAWESFSGRIDQDDGKLSKLHELAQLAGTKIAKPSCGQKNSEAQKPASKNKTQQPNSWRIRAAMPGRAWLDRKGQDGLTEVRPGDQLDGLGKVKTIEHDGRGGWILTAQNGALTF